MSASGPYDDIINRPHHVSVRHPRMSALDRAAQFSPFAALTGYGEEVQETARFTSRKIEPDEDQKAALDRQLRLLVKLLPERLEADFTYFVPDERKEGGSYVTVSGSVKRVDNLAHTLILVDGTKIPIEDIISIQCTALEISDR